MRISRASPTPVNFIRTPLLQPDISPPLNHGLLKRLLLRQFNEGSWLACVPSRGLVELRPPANAAWIMLGVIGS